MRLAGGGTLSPLNSARSTTTAPSATTSGCDAPDGGAALARASMPPATARTAAGAPVGRMRIVNGPTWIGFPNGSFCAPITRLPSTNVPLVDRSRTTIPPSASSTDACLRDTSSCFKTTPDPSARPMTMSGPLTPLSVFFSSADAISTSTVSIVQYTTCPPKSSYRLSASLMLDAFCSVRNR